METLEPDDRDDEGDRQTDRNPGIAAQSRKSVEKLLHDWAASGHDRYVEGIETLEAEVPLRADGQVWWCAPDEDEDASTG